MKKSLLQLAAMCVVAMASLASSAKGFAVRCAEKLHDNFTGLMARSGLMLFANFYSTEQTTLNGPNSGLNPATRIKANRVNGRIRIHTHTYTALGTEVVGSKIVFGKLPIKSRPIGYLGRMEWSAGAASSTLNLGDSVSAARHLAATAVTSAGSAVPLLASANGAIFETSDDTNTFANGFSSTTDDCSLLATVAGATLQAGQVITLTMPYVQD
jgi:hypothetical protein